MKKVKSIQTIICILNLMLMNEVKIQSAFTLVKQYKEKISQNLRKSYKSLEVFPQ